MTTSKKYANLTTNQLVTKETLKDNMFDYLNGENKEFTSQLFSEEGVIGEKLDLSISQVSTSVANVTIVGTSYATDGLGNRFDTDSTYSYCDGFTVTRPSAGSRAEIGLRHNVGPAFGGSESNVRTNQKNGNIVEYIAYREYIGEKGPPDSVSVLGSDIKLTVDSLTQSPSNVSYAGRKCLVYLKNPVSTVEAIAIQVLNVAWDGANNTVTVSSNKLGQGTPSTTASDYECILLGPTVIFNADPSIYGVSPYCFIGILLLNDIWSYDTSLQNNYNISLSALEEKVDSFNREIDVSYNFLTDIEPGRKANDIYSAKAGHAAVAYGDYIYYFGGTLTATFFAPATTCSRYNPSTNTWSAIQNMTINIPGEEHTFGMSAFVVDDLIYVIGGFNDSGIATNKVRIYNPETGQWSLAGGTIPTAMGRGVGFVVNNFIYYGCGQTEMDVSATTNFYQYDTSDDTVTLVSSPPANVAGAAYCLYKDKFYVIGGGADSSTITEQNYYYSYASDSWTTAPLTLQNPPYLNDKDGPYRFTPIFGLKENLFFIYQGHRDYDEALGATYVLSTMYIIDLDNPSGPHATTIPSYPIATIDSTGVLFDGYLFMYGGKCPKYYDQNPSTLQSNFGMNDQHMCFDLNYVFQAKKDLIVCLDALPKPDDITEFELFFDTLPYNVSSAYVVLYFTDESENQYWKDQSGNDLDVTPDSLGYYFYGQTGFADQSIGEVNSSGLAAMSFGYENYNATTSDGVGIAFSSIEDNCCYIINYPRIVSGSHSTAYHIIDDNFKGIYYDISGPNIYKFNMRDGIVLSSTGAASTAQEKATFKTKYTDNIIDAQITSIVSANVDMNRSRDWWPGLPSGHYKSSPPMTEDDIDGSVNAYPYRDLNRWYGIRASTGWYSFNRTKISLPETQTYLLGAKLDTETFMRVKNFTKNEVYRPMMHFEDQRILIPKGHIYGDILMSNNWNYKYSIIGGE